MSGAAPPPAFNWQEIINANADSQPPITIPCGKPSRKLAIVTCMDAWIDERPLLGVNLGEAHVIRNAGGNVQDALRSLIVSQQLLDTRAILVMKHTGCGMEGLTNQMVLDAISKCQWVHDKNGEANKIDFLGIKADTLHDAVRNAVAELRGHALIIGVGPENIRGCILDRQTRRIEMVD